MSQIGLQNPKSIDLITMTPQEEVVLVMIEDRPWDGSLERLAQLQAKINNYLLFAHDGAMYAKFPQTKGKPVLLRLDCGQEPDSVTLRAIATIRRQIQPTRIEINVR